MKLIKFSNVLIVFILIQLTNCLDLDEVDKGDIPQIIEARGFKCETHYITTSDGYILGNFRIVNPLISQSSFADQKLEPIIIQSGFLGSGVDFLINSPRGFANLSILESYKDLDAIDFDLDGRDLGFILANLGYDVWLTNPRGNYYSTNHTKLDPKEDSKEFWSFSLDEMANIDLPAMIDYVLQVTGRETLGYIGFSRGSLVMFGLLSDQPNYSHKVRPFIAMAPPVFLNDFQTPLRLLAKNKFVVSYIRDHPSGFFNRAATKVTGICSNVLIKPFCDMIKSSVLKIDSASGNKTRIDIYLSHLPAGSSCWDLIHFAQRMVNDNFSHIDLGDELNLKRYGSKSPPPYNLKYIINQHIAIIHSTGDTKANPKDVKKLIDQLEVLPVERITIDDEKFTHLDFFLDNNVGRLVNKPIARLLETYRSNHYYLYFTMRFGDHLVVLIVFILIQLTNCLDLDEIDKSDIVQIIEARGFICETHYITTSDGYILGNYRIVHPLISKSSFADQKLEPIIIQSGFLGSGVDFLINSPRGFANLSILESYKDLDAIDFDLDGRDLGFILANLGYDVWLTNPRGNYYSTNHTKLDPKKDSKEFWSFSLDEIANLDLPAIIDYVLSLTNQTSLGYIGYSRGSMVMFGLLSDQPNYCDKIKPFIAIAPIVYLNNYYNLPRIFAKNQFFNDFVRDNPSSCFDRSLSHLYGMCFDPLIVPFCDIIRMSLMYTDLTSGNSSRREIYLSHIPSGSSCWDFIHFAQRMVNDNFSHIDLGDEFNLKRYGSKSSPVYNLKNVKNKHILLIYSTGDEKANPKDVKKLIDHLEGSSVQQIIIRDDKFTHYSYFINNNIGLLVNKPIAKFLQKYRLI
ncbi:uncharacterized protein LOC128391973 [Panonychus citri]|uniref:uncharacterized protein LOC128391973 n=1 Tax=Panonychus citri TaxID=50023 RepID=UPI0023074C1A|nr:uncharacterized protein LOC128391973 [Panonychus citri]